MKILALAGSPRKRGNTDLLLDAFIAGAKSKGAEAAKVYLNDLEVRGCQACYACKKTGRCKQKDDMTKLYDELLAADVWVFATPVYWWGPSAQTKLALDRMFCLCHGPSRMAVRGKKAVIITASEDLPRKATPHLLGMFRESLAYLDLELAGELTVRAYTKGEVAKNPAALKKAHGLGARVSSP